MNNFKTIIFSKHYLKSNNFWLSFSFVIIFTLLLTVPSICFFCIDTLNIDTLFDRYGASKNNFPLLYNKIGELLPWVVVCLTALIVINGNTIFYFFTFKEELIEEEFQTKKHWFNIITFLFVAWAVCSAYYLAQFIFKYTDLTTILRDSKQENITDNELIIRASKLFNDFIHLIEIYTIITIIAFIFIDIFSVVVKNEQISTVNRRLNNENDKKSIKTFKKMMLQKEFATNQLFLIDIPVLIGIIIISIFTSHISPTIGNDMDEKYVFIAGGIGMHLIMSQVIFLILYLRYKFNEYKIDLAEVEKNNLGKEKDDFNS